MAELHHGKKPRLAILVFLFTFPTFLGMFPSAALPDIKTYFDITKDHAQQIISLYLLGCFLGQIGCAPVANAVGRKGALYLGVGLAILGSLLSLFAIGINHFPLLLLGRLLCAFGASWEMNLTNTILSDSFTSAEVKKHLSYLIVGFAVMPALGVTVGGWITQSLSWKGCFVAIFLYAAFVMGLCFFLPETAKEKHWRGLHPFLVAKGYWKQLCNTTFLLYTMLVACATTISYVFSSEAPFIARSQLGISAGHFGLYNLIPYIGTFFGGLCSAHLGKSVHPRAFLLGGAVLFFAASLAMWIYFDSGLITTLSLFFLPAILCFALPFIVSNGRAQAFAVSEDKAYASSSTYITQYLFMFLSIGALHLFSPQNMIAMPVVLSGAGALMLILWTILRMR
jgi:MFS family permease